MYFVCGSSHMHTYVNITTTPPHIIQDYNMKKPRRHDIQELTNLIKKNHFNKWKKKKTKWNARETARHSHNNNNTSWLRKKSTEIQNLNERTNETGKKDVKRQKNKKTLSKQTQLIGCVTQPGMMMIFAPNKRESEPRCTKQMFRPKRKKKQNKKENTQGT